LLFYFLDLLFLFFCFHFFPNGNFQFSVFTILGATFSINFPLSLQHYLMWNKQIDRSVVEGALVRCKKTFSVFQDEVFKVSVYHKNKLFTFQVLFISIGNIVWVVTFLCNYTITFFMLFLLSWPRITPYKHMLNKTIQ
jgi:hypothetical protein